MRGILTFDPTDYFSIVAKVEGGYRDFSGHTSQAKGDQTTEKFDLERNVQSVNPEEFDDTNFLNSIVEAEFDIGEFAITSITGYQEFDFIRTFSGDGQPLKFVDNTLSEDYEQFSQELRLTSPIGGAIDYIAGIYYSKDDDYISGLPLFDYAAFGLPFFGRTTGHGHYDAEIETLSAYGQLTWHVSDSVRLIAGIRHSDEEAEATYRRMASGWDPVTFQANPGVDPAQDAIAGRLPSSPFYAIFGNRSFNVAGKLEDKFTDPSLAIEFDMNDDILLYASYAEGSKAGGFISNSGSIGNNIVAKDAAWMNQYIGRTVTEEEVASSQVFLERGNGLFDFQPEGAEAFEVGAKMTLFNGRGTLNVALFQTKFEDLQVAVWDGVATNINNAGAATSQGVEIEFNMRVTEALTISASYGHLDATYDEYENTLCLQVDDFGTLADPNCVEGAGSLKGRQLQRSPENEATVSADWESQLTDGLNLRLGAIASYSDSYHVHDNESPAMTQKSFAKYDAYAGIASTNDRWALMLIGRNLGSEITQHDGWPVAVFRNASTSPPRYLTLEATIRF